MSIFATNNIETINRLSMSSNNQRTSLNRGFLVDSIVPDTNLSRKQTAYHDIRVIPSELEGCNWTWSSEGVFREVRLEFRVPDMNDPWVDSSAVDAIVVSCS